MADNSNSNTSTDKPKMEEDCKDADYIRLNVVGRRHIVFLIKPHKRLATLKEIFSKKCDLPVGVFHFLFGSVRIEDSHTPQQLGMQNGDFIDVYETHMGA